MPALDILIIKPGSQKQLYGDLSNFNLTAIEPPLWGALLAGYLRSLGFSVEILDAELENLSYEQTAKRVQYLKPILATVAVSGSNPSASTMNMTGAGQILLHIKKLVPETKTAIFGLHPSALPERTMAEERTDFLVQGEGFYTLPALISLLKSKDSGKSVPGLWRREGGKVVFDRPASLCPNLETLPHPAWDLLPLKRYRAHNWHCFDHIDERQPYAVLYTSLGCPFKCHFCCINSLFGKSGIRYRSPENVIGEIDYLVRTYGVKNIKIIDEMFSLKNDHVERICDLIIERRYNLNMWAYARVNTVNRSMLRKMKKAGINWVAYGFESANKRVLRDVDKKYDPDSLMDVVRMTKEEGLYICANYIFGLPEDDFGSMQETLDLALEINAEWANIYTAMAFPGSKLYQQARVEGWELPSKWEDYSQYALNTRPLPTRYISAEEVLRFRDRAFQIYYSNQEYLKMIGNKFGKMTHEHIVKMSSKKLPRWRKI